MTHKLTSTNTGRADTEQCARCGRRKRSDKLEPTPIGMCCRHCASVIAGIHGEDTTL